MPIDKRTFLTASLGLGAGLGGVLGASLAAGGAFAQTQAKRVGGENFYANRPKIPKRQAKTTALFKAPPGGFPNALAAAPEGLWIGQQKISGAQRLLYDLPEPADPSEVGWLVDMNGKLLKTVKSASRGTSGIAWDGHDLWFGADNVEVEGIFKTSLDGHTLSHRQIPLGPPANGGACHGLLWRAGKLWITAPRLAGGILRVDPVTWAPEFLIPVPFPRTHGTAWDDSHPGGAIWIVIGNISGPTAKPEDYRGGLAKFEAATGKLLETAEFVAGSSDPHGLTMREGVLYGCDAGIHPGWPNNWSKTNHMVFRIDLV